MAGRTILLAGFSLGAAMAALLPLGGCSPKVRDFGAGGGGMGEPCTPGEKMACYSGPETTKDIGLCKSGMKTCQPDRTYGACEGEVLPKAEDCKTPDDDDCSGVSEACPLTTLWAGGYGIMGSNNFASSVAAGDKGAVVLVGTLNGAVDFGGGGMLSTVDDDAFIAKFDPMGGLLWAKQVGGQLGQDARAVAVDATGAIYVGGSFAGTLSFGAIPPFTSVGGDDVFLAKLTPTGDPIWVLAGGDVALDQLSALALNSKGEVIIAGRFGGKLALGGGAALTATVGSTDLFVFKIGPDGKALWSASTNGMGTETANNIAVDANDDVYLATAYTGTFTLGAQIFTSLGGNDCFIAKLNGMTGGLAWGRSFGSTVEDRATGIAVDSKGEVVFSGSFGKTMTLDSTTLTAMGSESVFLARLDPTGKVLSATPYGNGASLGSGAYVTVDSKDNIVLGGHYNGTITFGGDTFTSTGPQFGGIDVFVAKFDPAGNHIASRGFGNDRLQAIRGIGLDSGDHILLGGGMLGSLDFGTGLVGATDVMVLSPFLVKLAP